MRDILSQKSRFENNFLIDLIILKINSDKESFFAYEKIFTVFARH